MFRTPSSLWRTLALWGTAQVAATTVLIALAGEGVGDVGWQHWAVLLVGAVLIGLGSHGWSDD